MTYSRLRLLIKGLIDIWMDVWMSEVVQTQYDFCALRPGQRRAFLCQVNDHGLAATAWKLFAASLASVFIAVGGITDLRAAVKEFRHQRVRTSSHFESASLRGQFDTV